jgi:uncharacterized repeat protein (TIGR02543 family)
MPSENITLYARWIIPIEDSGFQFIVTFETNGGSLIESITGNQDTQVNEPSLPTRTGHTFEGWYLDESFSESANFPFTIGDSDLTIYARWSINTYTITFNTTQGTAVDSITAEFDANLQAPTAPTRTGYTFNGWFIDSGLLTSFSFVNASMPGNNLTLFASWTPNAITINFNLNGGTSEITSITQDVDTDLDAPTAPSQTGHNFDNWVLDDDPDTIFEFETMPAENITIRAIWIINQYTISFESNQGTEVLAITQNFGTNVDIPNAPIREGYRFDDWASDINLTSPYEFGTMPAENITLYAIWIINQYTISFVSNGGSSINPINDDFGSDITEPEPPTREGYTFDGWFSNEALTEVYEFSSIPAENITLYAKWLINSYTISFESLGGSLVDPITQDFNTTLTGPINPTRNGFTFAGWYEERELINLFSFDEARVPAKNIELFAKWVVD